MPSSRQPTDDLERAPLMYEYTESLGDASPKHKHKRGKGNDAHARDETQDDDYRPEWSPNPRDEEKEKDRPRTLIVCFDGTGDQFDSDVSFNMLT